MTRQDQWVMTVNCVKLVRANYRLLREGGSLRATGVRRRQLRRLGRWLTVIDGVYAGLRRQRGKSGARARQDWLIARTIEMMVYDNADGERMRRHLAGPRMLNEQYVGRLTDAAIREIQAAAEEAGLFEVGI